MNRVPLVQSLRWRLKKGLAMEAWQRSRIVSDNVGRKVAFIRGQLPGRPSTLWIEATNRCNLHCVMCDRNALRRPLQNMEWGLFQKIAEQAKELRTCRIKLNRFGEPLMHPRIHHMTEHLKAGGVPWVFFATNATLLDEAAREAILESGLDHLVVSIDGYRKATYERIRAGARLDEVRRNVEELILLRRKRGRKRPFVQINAILMQDNASEIPDLIHYWSTRADFVNVRSYGTTGGLEDLSPLPILQPNQPSSPCEFLTSDMVVLVNGDVTVCCADFNGELVIDNVTKTNLTELWRGHAFERIRRLHREKRVEEFPRICRTCLATQKAKLKALVRKNRAMYRTVARHSPRIGK